MHALIIFLVAALLVVGFFGPKLFSQLSDEGLERELTQLENAPVSLTLVQEMEIIELPELSLYQSFSLLTSPYTEIELSEGQYLSRETVRNTAMSVIELLQFGETSHNTPDVITPYLLSSTVYSDLTGVFWCCTWTAHPNYSVWVEDHTGVVVSLALPVSGDLMAESILLYEYLSPLLPPELTIDSISPQDPDVSDKTDNFYYTDDEIMDADPPKIHMQVQVDTYTRAIVYLLYTPSEGVQHILSLPLSLVDGVLYFNVYEPAPVK